MCLVTSAGTCLFYRYLNWKEKQLFILTKKRGQCNNNGRMMSFKSAWKRRRAQRSNWLVRRCGDVTPLTVIKLLSWWSEPLFHQTREERGNRRGPLWFEATAMAGSVQTISHHSAAFSIISDRVDTVNLCDASRRRGRFLLISFSFLHCSNSHEWRSECRPASVPSATGHVC